MLIALSVSSSVLGLLASGHYLLKVYKDSRIESKIGERFDKIKQETRIEADSSAQQLEMFEEHQHDGTSAEDGPFTDEFFWL
jgi:hypothetical protein